MGSRARRHFEASFADMPKPSSFPAIANLIADDLGMLWVQDYQREQGLVGEWTVFDTAGRVVATASTPSTLRVRRVGRDYVLGLMSDADGVERVLVFPLRRE